MAVRFRPYTLVLLLVNLLMQRMAFAIAGTVPKPSKPLNVTTISAADGKSIFECWALDAPLITSNTPGVAGSAVAQLGMSGGTNVSFISIPPHFDGGNHNAPNVQYVALTSGLAHITLPSGTDQAWITGGTDGLIIAADVAAVSKIGHNTKYPSGEQSLAIQIPLKDGIVPAHSVLHKGPCRCHESPP